MEGFDSEFRFRRFHDENFNTTHYVGGEGRGVALTPATHLIGEGWSSPTLLCDSGDEKASVGQDVRDMLPPPGNTSVPTPPLAVAHVDGPPICVNDARAEL